MKRVVAPGVLVLLLALSGCTGTETTGAQSEATPAASTAQTGAQSTATDAPLVAATPVASESSDESTFVADVRAKLRPNNVIPDATDEQLIAAGEEACKRLASGESGETMSVIEGETVNSSGYYRDSSVIVTAAATTIC